MGRINAIRKGHTALVQALLQAGANCKRKTRKGSTALSRATDAGHKELIEVLRACGARQ